MDKQVILRKQVELELERCENLYEEFCKEIPELPKGALIEKRGKLNWYYRDNGKQHMYRISEEDIALIDSLKKRRYIKKGLRVLRQRIANCKRFLENDYYYDPVEMGKSFQKQYKDLQNIDVFLDMDINPYNWKSENYVHGKMYEANKIYEAGGLFTRSKSESLIAMRLKEKGFSFRYEPELRLSKGRAFPDFEVLLKRRRRIVYWEHLGMMDDPDYALKALRKIEEYAKNGIYLGYNLVITYETKERPLTVTNIDTIINELFEFDKI